MEANLSGLKASPERHQETRPSGHKLDLGSRKVQPPQRRHCE